MRCENFFETTVRKLKIRRNISKTNKLLVEKNLTFIIFLNKALRELITIYVQFYISLVFGSYRINRTISRGTEMQLLQQPKFAFQTALILFLLLYENDL